MPAISDSGTHPYPHWRIQSTWWTNQPAVPLCWKWDPSVSSLEEYPTPRLQCWTAPRLTLGWERMWTYSSTGNRMRYINIPMTCNKWGREREERWGGKEMGRGGGGSCCILWYVARISWYTNILRYCPALMGSEEKIFVLGRGGGGGGRRGLLQPNNSLVSFLDHFSHAKENSLVNSQPSLVLFHECQYDYCFRDHSLAFITSEEDITTLYMMSYITFLQTLCNQFVTVGQKKLE